LITKYWNAPEFAGDISRKRRVLRYHFNDADPLGSKAIKQCERDLASFVKVKKNGVEKLSRFPKSSLGTSALAILKPRQV
jgi:hypothetical protein